MLFSENLLVGPRITNVKPYGTIGAGDLYLNVSSETLGLALPNANTIANAENSISNNYLFIDVGGGVMYFFSRHAGARADLRYFRAYGVDVKDLENSELKLDRMDFWRAGFGAVFAF